jgi:hypothetical protein
MCQAVQLITCAMGTDRLAIIEVIVPPIFDVFRLATKAASSRHMSASPSVPKVEDLLKELVYHVLTSERHCNGLTERVEDAHMKVRDTHECLYVRTSYFIL